MKTYIIVFVVSAIFTCAFTSCDLGLFPLNPDEEGTQELKTLQADPNEVRGGEYPFVKPDLEIELNEETEPYWVPEGPVRGKLEPENLRFDIKMGNASQELMYEDYNEID